MYARGSEFLGHKFKNISIEKEYSILNKPVTTRNLQDNYITKRIHQVLDNLIFNFEINTNYVDEDDPWKGSLAEAGFSIRSKFNTTNKNYLYN